MAIGGFFYRAYVFHPRRWVTDSTVTTMALTVRELVELLQEVENQDLPVKVEGCDCDGEAKSIKVGKLYFLEIWPHGGGYVEKDGVLITRGRR